jgi:hypothetical protein
VGSYTDGGGNLVGGSALLAPLGDYGGPTPTMPPLPGSNAIGGGTTGTGVPATDQRGFARGASIDIGAFQTQGTTLVVNVTSDGVGSGAGQLSLRQAVNLADVQTTGDSISFDPSVFGTAQTITLTDGPLSLSDAAKTTIAGPGAGLLTISGQSKSRVFDIAGGSAALSGMSIIDGLADDGAGLRNDGGTLSLTNVTVSGNVASNDGGGLYTAPGGSTTLSDVTVSNNEASVGGGVAVGPGAASTLKNCTISGNSASSDGTGVASLGGTLSLVNVTVSQNTSTAPGETGAGLYITGSGSVTLRNTIVAAQASGGDVAGALQQASANNLIGNGSGMTGISNGSNGNQVGTDQAPINPLLAPLGSYGGPTQTMALLPGSPAIGGGGSGFGIPTIDQRGLPRTGHVDIGAFQSQGFAIKAVTGSTPQSVELGKPFKNPLAIEVTANNPAEPVNGGVVNFVVSPAGGASAALSSATAKIVGGQAAVNATANATPGPYNVIASALGAGSTMFDLSNIEIPGVRGTPGPIVVKLTDGLTSLREAIAYANSHPGPDTIILDPPALGARSQTIRLTGGPLVLTDPATTTIVGPGARLLTLSGGGSSRVFDIEGGSLDLSGVTITGGKADRGGGALNEGGRLALTDVVIRGNRARMGGGIFNDGHTTMSGVTIKGNRALIGGNVFNTTRATLHWRRTSPTHQARARVSIPSQERTSWVASK